MWEITQRYSTMREFTQWYSTTIYEMPRGDSTLLHSSNYYISSAARTHVLGFLSFKHRHLANCEHHKKVQSWQLVYTHNQNLTENLPKFCDSSPMMSLILFLIWRLSSKAITQSAFCTYVSEIYFYTFPNFLQFWITSRTIISKTQNQLGAIRASLPSLSFSYHRFWRHIRFKCIFDATKLSY